MKFDKLVSDIRQRLEANNISLANQLLSDAIPLVTTKEQADTVHTLGNEIQRAICEKYLSESESAA